MLKVICEPNLTVKSINLWLNRAFFHISQKMAIFTHKYKKLVAQLTGTHSHRMPSKNNLMFGEYFYNGEKFCKRTTYICMISIF